MRQRVAYARKLVAEGHSPASCKSAGKRSTELQ